MLKLLYCLVHRRMRFDVTCGLVCNSQRRDVQIVISNRYTAVHFSFRQPTIAASRSLELVCIVI